ncbi:MAG: helix-turn-helix domain-containing protein [Candidatus Bathyarchaeia archaeon]
MTLLITHLSTATQVSDRSGVPRSKIYSMLDSLKDKGWVRIYPVYPCYSVVRISNIPSVIRRVGATLKDKDLMIVFPQNQTPTEELKQLAPLATSEGRMFIDYVGQEANSDTVNLQAAASVLSG